MIRQPVVGRFYLGTATGLAQEVCKYLAKVPAPAAQPTLVMVPHTGDVYSGALVA